MKRIVTLFALALCFTGCDFFRTLASRPTSEDIARKRAVIEAAEAEHLARLDEQKRQEKMIADSLAAVDAIRQARGTIVSTGTLSGYSASQLEKRFYIMVGTFSKKANAEKIAAAARDAGYPAEMIAYKNGFTAVGLCASDNLSEISVKLQEIKSESFCPEDVWVLANE